MIPLKNVRIFIRYTREFTRVLSRSHLLVSCCCEGGRGKQPSFPFKRFLHDRGYFWTDEIEVTSAELIASCFHPVVSTFIPFPARSRVLYCTLEDKRWIPSHLIATICTVNPSILNSSSFHKNHIPNRSFTSFRATRTSGKNLGTIISIRFD